MGGFAVWTGVERYFGQLQEFIRGRPQLAATTSSVHCRQHWLKRLRDGWVWTGVSRGTWRPWWSRRCYMEWAGKCRKCAGSG